LNLFNAIVVSPYSRGDVDGWPFSRVTIARYSTGNDCAEKDLGIALRTRCARSSVGEPTLDGFVICGLVAVSPTLKHHLVVLEASAFRQTGETMMS